MILIVTGMFAVGMWRRAEDGRWCRDATTSDAVTQSVGEQRSICVTQRRRQRVMFGAVWRTGGETMADCGFQLTQLQLVTDDNTRAAILAAHGLGADGFEPSSRDDQTRFLDACIGSDG